MKPEKELHPFNEAGRMVKAAVITALTGESSIDRTLKGLPKDAGEPWAVLAELLVRGMQAEVARGGVQPPEVEDPGKRKRKVGKFKQPAKPPAY